MYKLNVLKFLSSLSYFKKTVLACGYLTRAIAAETRPSKSDSCDINSTFIIMTIPDMAISLDISYKTR